METFLKAMLENPTEVEKLIFCDWLEEEGTRWVSHLRQSTIFSSIFDVRDFWYTPELPDDLPVVYVPMVKRRIVDYRIIIYERKQYTFDKKWNFIYIALIKETQSLPLFIKVAAKYAAKGLSWPSVIKN